MKERPESYLITDDRRRIIHTHAGEKVGQCLTEIFFQIKYNIINIDNSPQLTYRLDQYKHISSIPKRVC